MNLFARDRTVLNSFGNDVHFAGAERDFRAPQFDIERPSNYKEEIVRIIVLVPNERALQFSKHHVVTVELSDGARRKVVGEQIELFLQIDFFGHWFLQ